MHFSGMAAQKKPPETPSDGDRMLRTKGEEREKMSVGDGTGTLEFFENG